MYLLREQGILGPQAGGEQVEVGVRLASPQPVLPGLRSPHGDSAPPTEANARRGVDGVLPSFDLKDGFYAIGIAPEQQEKIFEEFYRVDDPQVQETGGSGLGLAVVKHIVEAHKGRLTVQSNPNDGSKFSIHLPVQEKPVANEPTK